MRTGNVRGNGDARDDDDDAEKRGGGETRRRNGGEGDFLPSDVARRRRLLAGRVTRYQRATKKLTVFCPR